MAVVVAVIGRFVRPGDVANMHIDSLHYRGEELLVEITFSDFAEQVRFACSNIWKLAKGKGNSSQHMARFGCREMRKCVNRLVRSNG